MNTQEPHFSIPTTTSAQPLIQSIDTSTQVDTTMKIDIVDTTQIVEVKEPTNEQAKQTHVSIPDAQN